MSRPIQLTSWQSHLASRFPDLSAPVVAVLALYSFGMILSKVSGLCAVSLFLSEHLDCRYFATRKRLSEFYKEAEAKSGTRQGQKRKDFDVTTCFAPLLKWILSLWPGRYLALAIDVTNLGDRFHVLCISVVVQGTGIPVAWAVLPGGEKDAWNPHWQRLLGYLKTAVPDDWTVIVLSDRGLESPELFRQIVALGWHPLMRAKKGGKFRPKGWGKFYIMSDLVRRVGGSFSAEGLAYTGRKMPCTLLACWSEGHDEPWLVLTDLPPEAGNAVWYGFRTWIEQGFKVIKGGGWEWQNTRMEDAGRVERLWLVMSVATLWVVAVGAEDEAQEATKKTQKEFQRKLEESEQQARERQERERVRRENQKAALDARRAKRKAVREAREAREAEKSAKAGKVKPKEEAAKGKAAKPKPRKKEEGKLTRTHRLFALGLAVLSAAWQRGENRLPRRLYPEPWPQPCHPVPSLTEEEFLSQKT